ncbi:PEP-CTERM sorting domain-containing protein [Sphingomonadaceae bacterium]|nr:PEP-CTERM sorting domain-containing protein [Sphingomonadaceae bacterium]
MKSYQLALAGLGLSIAVTGQALAQDQLPTREATIEYSGQLTESVEANSRLVSDDVIFTGSTGSSGMISSPLASDLPAYPVQPGDPFTLTVTTQLPTLEALQQSGIVPDSNGIFQFAVESGPLGSNSLSDLAGASITSIEVSEPFGVNVDGAGARFFVEYDPATDTYSPGQRIGDTNEFGRISGVEVPTYQYDAASDSYSVCGGTQGPTCSGGTVALAELVSQGANQPRFSAERGAFGQGNPVETFGTREPETRGFFDLIFGGSWTFSDSGSGSGGATPVPAPPMMILFGLAVAAVLGRRKWSAKLDR